MSIKITDANGRKPTFTQWDVDRVLQISGCATKPYLHFSNRELKRALVVESEASGSDWTCDVPNFVLQFPGPLTVSVFLQPNEGKTVLREIYQVMPKKKPQDYTYEENIGYVNWIEKATEAEALITEIEAKLESGELKGDPFTYEDFTAAQLAALTGPQGAAGNSFWTTTETPVYVPDDSDIVYAEFRNLVGRVGVSPAVGDIIVLGSDAVFQIVSVSSNVSLAMRVGTIKGDKGDKGDTGDKGDKGDTGATGANGQDGADGADGNSIWTTSEDPLVTNSVGGTTYIFTVSLFAGRSTVNAAAGDLIVASSADVYQIKTISSGAAECIFVESIKGATGAAGVDGADGADGADGNSIWTTSETPLNAGTKYVFTTSQLSGADTTAAIGDLILASTADVYQVDKVNSSTVEAVFVENIKGATGANGADGADGNAIWTTSETPLPATGGYAFTASQLSGRSTPGPEVGDIIIRSSEYVYQVVEITSNAVIGSLIGNIKGASGSGGSVIPSGSLDSTSTATAMTATITGITSLSDGVCMWLTNGVIASATGVTLNINGLGAKPIYNSLTGAVVTTTFTAASTFLFVYNSTRVTGGCWDMVYGYDTNTTYTPVKLGFGYATCDTAAATAAKTAALSSYTLTTGGIVSVKFTNAVGAGATLNINSKGAKAIYYQGSAITAGVIKAGDTATFIYSTYYHLIAIDRQEHGMPSGGSQGAVLLKSSSTDYDAAWTPLVFPEEVAVFNFSLTCSNYSDIFDSTLSITGPLWSEVDGILDSCSTAVAKVTLAGGSGMSYLLPLTEYHAGPNNFYAAFVGTNNDGVEIRVGKGGNNNEWYIDVNKYAEEINAKLDANLGFGNAGKFLVVGNDGGVTAVTMAVWQGGLF